MELKSDLPCVLPKEIRELLLWHSTDVGVTFQKFRDTIGAQTAQVLLNRGDLRSINAVDKRETLLKLVEEMQQNGGGGEEGGGDFVDDFVGALQAQRGKFVPRGGGAPEAPEPPGPPAIALTASAGRACAPTAATRIRSSNAFTRRSTAKIGFAGRARKPVTPTRSAP